MSQSPVRNLVHLVCNAKHRKLWTQESIRERIWAYQAGVFNELESPAVFIGGVEDHVHALCLLTKNYTLKKKRYGIQFDERYVWD